MNFSTPYWEYEAALSVNSYTFNGRLYLWLVDKYTGEPLIDISENHPELTNEQLEITSDWQKVILDNDFIQVCGSVRNAKIRCMDNIEWVLGGCEVDWRPAIYVPNHLYANER